VYARALYTLSVQGWILKAEQSGLWTRIAATESGTFCVQMEGDSP